MSVVFPKNLAYSLKELGDAGFTKQKVKVLGDKLELRLMLMVL